jgi:hypothetical protein
MVAAEQQCVNVLVSISMCLLWLQDMHGSKMCTVQHKAEILCMYSYCLKLHNTTLFTVLMSALSQVRPVPCLNHVVYSRPRLHKVVAAC